MRTSIDAENDAPVDRLLEWVTTVAAVAVVDALILQWNRDGRDFETGLLVGTLLRMMALCGVVAMVFHVITRAPADAAFRRAVVWSPVAVLPSTLEALLKWSPWPTPEFVSMLAHAGLANPPLMAIIALVAASWLSHRAARAYTAAVARQLWQWRVCYFLALYGFGLLIAQRKAPLQAQHGLASADVIPVVLLGLALLAGALSTIMMNDLADVAIDRVSNPARLFARGAVDAGRYRTHAYVLLSCAAGLALVASARAGLLLLAVFAVYHAYSAAPLRIKRLPLVAKLVVSINSLLVLMLGFAYLDLRLHSFPRAAMAVTLGGITLLSAVLDLKDHEGDRRAGLRTLPVVLGVARAKRLLGVMVFAVHVSPAIVYGWHPLLLPLIAVGAVQAAFINQSAFDERKVLGLLTVTLLAVGILYAR